jgi:putative glutamine amidotransferase
MRRSEARHPDVLRGGPYPKVSDRTAPYPRVSGRKPRIGITVDAERRKGRLYATLDHRYARAIASAGGVPLLLPIVGPHEISSLLASVDGLLLTGGEDIHPRFYGERPAAPLDLSPDERTTFELDLVKTAMRSRKPVLGICHGMQLLNVALGGSLIQDLPTRQSGALRHRSGRAPWKAVHPVALRPRSLLRRILRRAVVSVASTHHQAVKALGKGLEVSALAPDGVVEAVESPRHPFLIAVQWHPEKDPDAQATRRLFRALVRACRG